LIQESVIFEATLATAALLRITALITAVFLPFLPSHRRYILNRLLLDIYMTPSRNTQAGSLLSSSHGDDEFCFLDK